MMSGLNVKVDTICFDYYMTLVDLNNPFGQIKEWIELYIQSKYPSIDTKKFYGRFIRYRAVYSNGPFMLGIDVLINSLKKACEIFQIPDFSDDFGEMIEALFMDPEAFKDAKMIIDRLKKRYSVGLLSNADNYILYPSIKKNGFNFDFIITSDDAKANKPNTKIFDYALDKLKKQSQQVIMIGDSQIEDIWGATCRCISTIWLNRKREKIKEEISQPLYIAENLAEILEYLDN